MRTARLKADTKAEVAHYHCISRVVERRFAMGKYEKEHFIKLMRGYEVFCGVRVVTFCVMSSHFHLLVEVPKRPAPDQLPDDKELIRRVRKADCCYDAATLEQDLERHRAEGDCKAAEELRERFFARMWDVSWFLRLLKQRFTQWFNSLYSRTGTLWEGRFRSVLVEGAGPALAIIAAYIDLNPVRAGMVTDPKEYRWSGYGQAVAGGSLARAGLKTAVEAKKCRAVAPKQVMAIYRSFLYESGAARRAGSNGEPGRRGFSREQIQEVLARGGKLELEQALRCRVRYFCDGVVLGSRAFVERVFESHRGCFGRKRETGARKLEGINAPGLFVVRAVRVNLFG